MLKPLFNSIKSPNLKKNSNGTEIDIKEAKKP